MEPTEEVKLGTATNFINSVFDQDLADQLKYDPDVVRIVRRHLGGVSIHSRAGWRLAQDLADLARTRAKGVEE